MLRGRYERRSVLSHRDLTLYPAAQEAKKLGFPLALEPLEYALLQALIEEPARVVRRTELEQRLRKLVGDDPSGVEIEALIENLRSKIGIQEIVAVRGVGYRLRTLA